MHVDPRECMFCHTAIPARNGEPVNLTFLSHVNEERSCRRAWEAWMTNMDLDFKGD